MASSALTIPGQFGATPIINNTGIFPGQIDRMGNNLVEAIDDLGDIRGRTKDQPYYCVLVPDQRHRDTNTTMPRVFTHFGVILFKAPAMFTQLLTQWFERRFDCRTSHLVFQTYDLRKIVESSLEISYNHAQGDDNGNERPIEFYYSLPQTVSALKTISVSLAPDDSGQGFKGEYSGWY
ncbi:hypothetical protein FBU30_003354 [Linnemannia zychae]|nr:hypothetical protein FBU30_003354 [Linnemannia zychae]